MMRAVLTCWILVLLACSGSALAHKASDSYVTLQRDSGSDSDRDSNSTSVRWDLSLADLQDAIGLDQDRDGNITWGELRTRHGAIAAYARAHLAVSSVAGPCAWTEMVQRVAQHSDGAYSSLSFALDCAVGGPTRLDYSARFAADPGHRAIVRVLADGAEQLAVLSDSNRGLAIEARGSLASSSFWLQGVLHLLAGFDHLLFLLVLTLPCLHARGVRAQLGPMVCIVTTFTLAHSVTLALAALELVSVPSQIVESAIALSIIVAALLNLVPRRPAALSARTAVVFALGLLHGLGFAGVLDGIDAGGSLTVLALAWFNLGIEAGQLAVVACAWPLLAWLAKREPAQRFVLRAGSVLAATVGGAWFVERALQVSVNATVLWVLCAAGLLLSASWLLPRFRGQASQTPVMMQACLNRPS